MRTYRLNESFLQVEITKPTEWPEGHPNYGKDIKTCGNVTCYKNPMFLCSIMCPAIYLGKGYVLLRCLKIGERKINDYESEYNFLEITLESDD